MKTKLFLKKCASVFVLVALLCTSISATSLSASAATTSTKYAYSIGVNHGGWAWLFGGLQGDFTPNVNYASICYGMISNTTSYKNYQPNYTYMRGNNPDGTRRIASNIVFLNGHANYDNLCFNYDNNNGDYATGVYIGNDYDSPSSGYKYVGLGSTNMNTCDHISFVGCSTAANGNYNLTWKAVNKGANSALGFTDSIHSRSNDGKGWLQKYNDALANGYTISRALTYAANFYSSSDLGTYAKIYGSSSNTVASASKSTSSNLISVDTSIEFSEKGLNNFSLVSENKSLIVSNLVKAILKIDPDFKANEYKMTINMFAPQDGNGMIIMSYMVDDIKTDKAYIATIENNKIVNVSANATATKILRNEVKDNFDKETLQTLVKDFKSKNDLNSKALTVKNVVKTTENYYYNIESGVLTYEGSIFYANPEADNAIFDITTETVLNK